AIVVVGALLGSEELGVVDPLAVKIAPRDGSTGHHGTRPASTTRFIDAGNRRVTQAKGLPLEDPEVPLSLRSFRSFLLRLRCRQGRQGGKRLGAFPRGV